MAAFVTGHGVGWSLLQTRDEGALCCAGDGSILENCSKLSRSDKRTDLPRQLRKKPEHLNIFTAINTSSERNMLGQM